MKNIFRFILTLWVATVSFSSCNEWLEATSDMELPADKLFQTRGGFRDALSGIYISMGDDYAYGKYYTWYSNELTSYPYVPLSSASLDRWQKHVYTHETVKNELASMWQQGYEVIANVNIALRELDRRRNVITSDVEYKLFKGELHAVRAYVHFDLMRMFGLGNWDGDNATKLTIPYVTVYDKEPVPQQTYAETEKLLLKDINTALECLESVDPITGVEIENFDATINEDGFWSNRTLHLNYYAVRALAARVYQWKNDYKSAAEHAQSVIDNTLEKGVVSWVDVETLLLNTNNDSRDWSFVSEHIFSLTVPELYSKVSSYLLNSTYSSAFLLRNSLIEDVLFPIIDANGSVAGAEDIRGTAVHLRYSALGYTCYKLYGSSVYAAAFRNRMPMVKISEMYYIVAENLISQGYNSDALEILNEVRRKRGITDDLPENTDVEQELTKEYYREFICEGQLFYWLKHKDVSSSLDANYSVKASDLIYPYPDEEVNYGRVQEL